MSKKPQRYCKRCGIKVGKGKSYCPNCRKRRKYKICGFEGCKKLRTYYKHSCEYHSRENRHIRYYEEIVKCSDCGCDLGKRKNYKHRNQRICNDCRQIRKKKNRKRRTEYKNHRYNNDEEYRKRNLEYQKNYKEMKNKKLKMKRSQ